jgi:hypothetical protein
MTYTAEEKMEAARREAQYRVHVYGRNGRGPDGGLSTEQRRGIAIMKEIENDYRIIMEKTERLL